MKQCIACSMPLIKSEDFAGGDFDSNFCVHCANEKGEVKSCEEIFQGGVQFFISATGASQSDAEKLVRKNMKSLPYWQGKTCACFAGEEASDEEFQAALQKISH